MGQNETRVDSGRRTARRVTWGRERQPLQYVENGCTARHRPSLRQRRTAASQALGTNKTPRAKRIGTNETPRALSARDLPQAGKLAASLNRRKPSRRHGRTPPAKLHDATRALLAILARLA